MIARIVARMLIHSWSLRYIFREASNLDNECHLYVIETREYNVQRLHNEDVHEGVTMTVLPTRHSFYCHTSFLTSIACHNVCG